MNGNPDRKNFFIPEQVDIQQLIDQLNIERAAWSRELPAGESLPPEANRDYGNPPSLRTAHIWLRDVNTAISQIGRWRDQQRNNPVLEQYEINLKRELIAQSIFLALAKKLLKAYINNHKPAGESVKEAIGRESFQMLSILAELLEKHRCEMTLSSDESAMIAAILTYLNETQLYPDDTMR